MLSYSKDSPEAFFLFIISLASLFSDHLNNGAPSPRVVCPAKDREFICHATIGMMAGLDPDEYEREYNLPESRLPALASLLYNRIEFICPELN